MKRGTTREDGKVFARILNGKELWLTKEQYEKREKSRKEYVKRCMKMYYSRRKSVRKIGEYDYNKNLYFCGISSSGKEVWKKKYYYEKVLNVISQSKKKYLDRCKQKYPPTNLKIGDVNPNNPNQFVVLKIGNKLFFGSKAKLEEKKEKLRMIYLKRSIKAKKIREIVLSGKIDRLKKGTTRVEDNKIFWEYNRVGKEVWLDPEIFHFKRNKCLEKRKNYRKKKKEAMLLQNNNIQNKERKKNDCSAFGN
jgi:hypothetical protein